MFELLLSSAVRGLYLPDSGPGSKYLTAGSTTLGYFGKVLESELVTFDEIRVLPEAGETYNPPTPVSNSWLKFIRNGKILYVPSKPLLYQPDGSAATKLTWNQLYNKGLVYGTDDDGKYPTTTPTNQHTVLPVTDRANSKEHGLIVRMPSMNIKDPVPTTEYGQIDGAEWYDLIKVAQPSSDVASALVQSVMGQNTQDVAGYLNFMYRGNNTASAAWAKNSAIEALLWSPVLELTSKPIVLADTWSTLPDLPSDMIGHSSCVIGNKLYLYGSQNAPKGALYSIDLTTGDLTTLASGVDSTRHTAVAINGKMYVYGGFGTAYMATIRVYDPATNTWNNNVNNTGAASDRHAAFAFNGKLYAYGGGTAAQISSGREYDPVANKWTTIASGTFDGNPLSFVQVDNKGYLFGGYQITTAKQFAEVTASAPAMRVALPGNADNMYGAAMGYGKDGIYLFGGYVGTPVLTKVRRYDIESQTWRELGDIPVSVTQRAAASTYNGKIYLTGGQTSPRKVQVYTP